jgi:NADPH-dependent 2,4-dienoyl-CoA reductase/sulfur reductase-like enzyme
MAAALPSRSGARLVVIGGDAAGMSAAAEVRRADPDREIVVLERGPDVSYAACGIPYLIGGEIADADDLVHHDPEYFLHRRGIEVRTGVEALAVDPEARTVRCSDGDDVGYGALVIATGARPVRPPVPGADLPGVLTLRDLASARRLRDLLAPLTSPSVLLVGSGPIGMEMAEALIARGVRVQIVESAPRVLPALDEGVAAPVVAALEEAGVRARASATLERIVIRDGRPAATIDGREQIFDLILLGTGVRPNSEIAASAGCELGERGAIAIDRHGRTTVDGIWAAGDCATAHHLLLGRQMWIPLATTANVQGRIAARDVVGDCGDEVAGGFAGTLGSWVSRFGPVSFGATGVDARAALEAGFTPETVLREGRDRSGYMPGARPIVVRLVWDRATGRLLGGQVAGSGEVSTRLHAISVALWGGLTVRGLAECDLGYAPPLSPLRDPVQLAAAAAIGDAP